MDDQPGVRRRSGAVAATREQRLEGVVAKRVDAAYKPARRSDAWVKAKHVTRTALPIVAVRDDAVLVADSETFRPIGWVDRFHPSIDRGPLTARHRTNEPLALCVVQHLASDSGGLREPLLVALRPMAPGQQTDTSRIDPRQP